MHFLAEKVGMLQVITVSAVLSCLLATCSNRKSSSSFHLNAGLVGSSAQVRHVQSAQPDSIWLKGKSSQPGRTSSGQDFFFCEYSFAQKLNTYWPIKKTEYFAADINVKLIEADGSAVIINPPHQSDQEGRQGSSLFAFKRMHLLEDLVDELGSFELPGRVRQVIPAGEGKLLLVHQRGTSSVSPVSLFDGKTVVGLELPSGTELIGWGFVGEVLSLACVDKSGQFWLFDATDGGFSLAKQWDWAASVILRRKTTPRAITGSSFVFADQSIGFITSKGIELHAADGSSETIKRFDHVNNHPNGWPRSPREQRRVLEDPSLLSHEAMSMDANQASLFSHLIAVNSEKLAVLDYGYHRATVVTLAEE
jgi:hypothetical protein